MNAKEKALELIEKYKTQTIDILYQDIDGDSSIISENMTHKSAIKCALVAVDEIIKDLKQSLERIQHPFTHGFISGLLAYWNAVKKELNEQLKL